MSPKAERFVAEYLIDLNATQAAIRAGYSKHTASSQGERLLRNVEVCADLKRRQAAIAETHGMSVDQHLADLKRIRDAAFDDRKFAASATAEMARGKVAGFYVDKVEMAANVRGSVSYVANLPPRNPK